jgi:hypothetical protein
MPDYYVYVEEVTRRSAVVTAASPDAAEDNYWNGLGVSDVRQGRTTRRIVRVEDALPTVERKSS